MSSSSPSYTPASYSNDVSSYATGRPRDDPPNVQEYEDSSNSESEQEVSSERDPYDGPRVSPTTVLPRPTPTIVQPQTGGLRIRQTARKSVPIPRRVTLSTPRPEAPEPSRVVTGVPIRQMAELTLARDQHIRAMTTELHGCQVRVTHQAEVLTELVELAHQLAINSNQARDGVRMAREMASRAQAASLVVGMVLLLLMFLLVIGAYLE